ncbi:DsbA family protein [Georgenia thermotolerans]|uniref:Thioredoxin domain-containing protein n=1 Tax=Georgenia thermotolerans TaxID=527326 RepID=A0A7J5UNW4_9MICO|nr:thioredoxin domain-containing protein [Georgenia thermotolerans]KAE8764092.1 thioredoxin domain-containing protein [Georgenia thermotolerans]
MSSNISKAEKREAAREQARQLREAQARRERRNRNLLITGVIVLIVVVAVAVFAIVRQGSKPAISAVKEVPANTQVKDGGISLGSSLTAGTANEGAPTIDVYLDYTCPYCAQFEKINADSINELVKAGDATVVYHPVAILDRTGNFSGFSGRAAAAAATVADKAPEAFNAFHTALYDMYTSSGATEGVASTEPDEQAIIDTAVKAGVPQDVANTVGDGTFTDWVGATTEQFRKDGFSGTPTVLINGKDFQNWSQPGALADAVKAAQ